MATNFRAQIRPQRSIKKISHAAYVQKGPHSDRRSYSLFIWAVLIGIFSPPVLFPLGGVNLTPGRLVVILLLVPALGLLFTGRRNIVASDFFAVALATWMLASSVLNGGFKLYVGAEALEVAGAYLAGRSFFFGPSNLQTFIRVLGLIAIVIVVLAVVDVLADRYVTLDSFGVPHGSAQRFNRLRAASVFEGAEHYGTFCVVATSIFLYSERGIRRIFLVGVTSFGCALSLSSGPAMGMLIVIAVFLYDGIMTQYPWRWKLLIATVAGFISIVFMISNNPIAWLIVHATLNPQTGFWRIGTWNHAVPIIQQSPLLGHGMNSLVQSGNAQLFLHSIDCLYLVEALRYGIPAVVLLLLTMLWPFLTKTGSTTNPKINHFRSGISVAIISMGLIGITVHFWDSLWLLLNLLMGIRASLAEYDAQKKTSPFTLGTASAANSTLAKAHRANP